MQLNTQKKTSKNDIYLRRVTIFIRRCHLRYKKSHSTKKKLLFINHDAFNLKISLLLGCKIMLIRIKKHNIQMRMLKIQQKTGFIPWSRLQFSDAIFQIKFSKLHFPDR